MKNLTKENKKKERKPQNTSFGQSNVASSRRNKDEDGDNNGKEHKTTD